MAPGREGLFDSAGIREALGVPREAPGGRRGDSPAGQRRTSRPDLSVSGPWYTSVSTDTRTLRPGALFVALAGQRHDAMEFLERAAAAGARGAIVPADRPLPALNLEWFPVQDPLRALGALAAFHRRRVGARVVGITGTSGKTTVKEMTAAALSGVCRVHRTPGNRNSQVGLPLSMFEAPEDAEVWVLELGASEPGEIARLTLIAAPDDAVVTTVGPAHLEFFADETAILREKLTLVAGAERNGVVVVGETPLSLAREARALRPDTIVAGVGPEAGFRPDRYGVEVERVWFERAGVRFTVPVGGLHHLRDALLAAAVAEALGVPAPEAARGLETFRPLGMRGELRQWGALTVVADCYNANPESFAAAIDYCAGGFGERRRVAVIGTMLELGAGSAAAHERVAARLVEAGFSLIAATGEFAGALRAWRESREGTEVLTAPDADSVWPALAERLAGDEVVLVKGSRGVRLETLVARLKERFGGPDGPEVGDASGSDAPVLETGALEAGRETDAPEAEER